MFTIVKNTFINDGICKYEDEHGNTMFFKRWIYSRNEEGFTAKLRFKAHPIKVASYEAAFPIDYEKNKQGFKINMEYPKGYDLTQESVQNVLAEFSNMIVHWDSMIHAIKLLECNNKLLMKQYPEAKSEEEIQVAKINNLYQYKELNSFIEKIFQPK